MADISIAGAGWFGCHLAKSLATDHKVTICDSRGVFTGASGSNQNRLHLGFHYPRSHATRQQSKEGFERFVETYPDLSEKIDNNWYSIKADESLVDFETYKAIMRSSGLDFVEGHPGFTLLGMAGHLRCGERLIKTEVAKAYFEQALDVVIADAESLGPVTIDCTGGELSHRTDYTYEPCVMLQYTGPTGHPAITIMDGPFFTIYPTEHDSIFTVYSVSHTPVYASETYDAARKFMLALTTEDITHIRKLIEDQIAETYPDFRDLFKFDRANLSVRNKSLDRCDVRCCNVSKIDGRIIVTPGKIDNIFYAEDEVRRLLHANHCL